MIAMRLMSCFEWALCAAVMAVTGCSDDTSSSSSGGGNGQGGATSATGTASGSMSTGATMSTSTSASTASGGGTQGSCDRWCVTLLNVGCVEDHAQCLDGCLILAEGDPCPNELNAVHDCEAEFVSDCADPAPECDDEDLAYEICLSN